MLTESRVAALKAPALGQQEHRDHRVTGLRLRIGAGGTKTWIFRGRAGARIVNKKLGTFPGMGLATARIEAERLLEAIAKGGSAEAVERTFGAVAGFWIKNVAKRKNDSWRLQQRQLELHVLPVWGERKITDIRRAHVRDLVEALEGDVLPNRILTLIKTIFRFALSRDWIDFSPADAIRKPKDEKERDRVLTMVELAWIWKASRLAGYPFGPFTMLLILTAQRRTEVASMRWRDLDLDGGNWIIRSDDTKADRKHLVPLSPLAVQTLKDLPRMGDYVFTSDGESHISGFASAKAKLDGFIAGLKGPVEPWRFHDLRRTAATHMVRLGILETVVGRVLNHALTGVTAKVYALHSYAPEKRQALDAWAEDLTKAIDGASADPQLRAVSC
jgi:integrase